MGCATSSHGRHFGSGSLADLTLIEGTTPKKRLSFQKLGEASSSSTEPRVVVVRVVKATLTRNFEVFGVRMDPFATVAWVGADGSRWEASRTRTDWNAHMHPQWDHWSRGRPYEGVSNDVIEIRVFEQNMAPIPSILMGAARIAAADLFGGKTEALLLSGPIHQPVHGPEMELELRCGASAGELVGKVMVQGMLVPSQEARLGLTDQVTRADAKFFECSARRIGVSGGTAAFYEICLRNPKPGRSASYYIGKDLTHAADEVGFYEKAVKILKEPELSGGLAPVLSFCLRYGGILTCVDEEQRTRDVLLLRNLRDGCIKLRLLDIKIGQKTGQAGWHGKSRAAALRQSLVDGITNSACEGFRLEGFDHGPPALESMDPLLDLGLKGGSKVAKKALRVMFQRMSGAEMLLHFIDVHQVPREPPPETLADVLSPSEVVEVTLHEALIRLLRLATACRKAPVPQKWIGSSVALGFEVGCLPPREDGEALVRQNLKFHIFDWGRSELNTMENHSRLSGEEQRDRTEFWGYYVGGIDRLAWEVARAYRHRYSNAGQWQSITFRIFDFDSMSDNDFLGKVNVPCVPTEETTLELKTGSGNEVHSDFGFRGAATITYSIEWRSYPKGSRLRGAWRVRLIRAEKLPRSDKSQFRLTSDPLCEVAAHGEDGALWFRQLSTVKVRTLNPVWGETFELPIAAQESELEAAITATLPNFFQVCEEPMCTLLPAERERPQDWREESIFRKFSSDESTVIRRTSLRLSAQCLPGLLCWRSGLDAAIAAAPEVALAGSGAPESPSSTPRSEASQETCPSEPQTVELGNAVDQVYETFARNTSSDASKPSKISAKLSSKSSKFSSNYSSRHSQRYLSHHFATLQGLQLDGINGEDSCKGKLSQKSAWLTLEEVPLRPSEDQLGQEELCKMCSCWEEMERL